MEFLPEPRGENGRVTLLVMMVDELVDKEVEHVW